jgi:D-glycero-alpha-D-manno-heptose 1-phosphate guanylyltransferase
MREAIVLAGGLGTRLRPVVKDIPKPMAAVKGRPFLEYILRYLGKNGVERVILAVGYKWQKIEEYFGDSFEGIELIYSVENEPMGTGGAIKKALSLCEEESFLIVNGDTFFDLSISDFEKSVSDKALLALSLKKMYDFDRYGVVECEKGRVVAFDEKEWRESGLINGGVYIARRDIFEGHSLPKSFSFEEFMQANIEKLAIECFESEGFFIDIGIPEDYEIAQSYECFKD